MTKGIILAGGSGTRLYPLTKAISKQLLPIYDKPMIYYPLSILMMSGIKDILIISTPRDLPMYEDLLGDGEKLGLFIKYAEQKQPNGLAEAFIIGEKFVGNDSIMLILGDNLFWGKDIKSLLKRTVESISGATLFGYRVTNPQEFGVIEFNSKNEVISLEEKPKIPKSNFIATGLYFYDNDVIKIAKSIKPSARGELEITDINKVYLEKNKLKVNLLDKDYFWWDTGTHDSLIEATNSVKKIEDGYGIKIGCIEEIAFKQGYISKEQLLTLAKPLLKTNYGKYLLGLTKNS